jgi:hypothetical protein
MSIKLAHQYIVCLFRIYLWTVSITQIVNRFESWIEYFLSSEREGMLKERVVE